MSARADTSQHQTAPGSESTSRWRLTSVAIGLVAVYLPIALALALHRTLIGKAYIVLAIWAVEGILWQLRESRADRDGR